MEKNTDRMWWTIGAVLLGGILIAGFLLIANNNFTPKLSEKMNALIKTPEPSNKINPDDAKWVQKGDWGSNGYFVRDNAGNGIVYALDPQQPVIAPETPTFTYDNGDLTSLRFLDKTILPKSSNRYFASNSKLTTFETKNLDTSNVTSMYGMFNGMYALTALDVSKFDTSNVTDMSEMFANMPALTSLDVSKFDTSKVTTMRMMFADMNALTALDVSKFDTSNVTDMSEMFYSMDALTALDVSNFNTSNVTDVYGMFGDMPTLSRPDTSKFETSKMTGKDQMFARREATYME